MLPRAARAAVRPSLVFLLVRSDTGLSKKSIETYISQNPERMYLVSPRSKIPPCLRASKDHEKERKRLEFFFSA